MNKVCLALYTCFICFCLQAATNKNFFVRGIYDGISIHRNLFSVDSVKVGMVCLPWYGVARQTDQGIQSSFYCNKTHTNKKQIPQFCHDLSSKGVPALVVGLSLFSFHSDEHISNTARVFAAGIPYVWGCKNILKCMQYDCNLRPKCQYFDSKSKYYGGCPSGHMAFMAYATTVFGLQFGAPIAIPLGMLTGGVLGCSLNSNRHFLSQVVAGVGIGVLYGLGATKVIDKYCGDDIGYSFSCTPTDNGAEVSFSYSF